MCKAVITTSSRVRKLIKHNNGCCAVIELERLKPKPTGLYLLEAISL